MPGLKSNVHTGDLELIENVPIRNIMKMGDTFRETPPFIPKCHWTAHKKSSSTKRKIFIFDSWKHVIIQEIDKVLKSLPITFESFFIIDRPEVRQEVEIYISILFNA